MPDLNIELALDALCTAVEGVTPRREAMYPFERHSNAELTLEEYGDVDGIRKFQWVDASVVVGQADDGSAWYSYVLELWIFYPAAYWADSDTTFRGVSGIRLADTIDLNKVLMFGDPFAALSFEYYKLQMQRTRKQGKILVIPYLVQITESLAA